VLVIAHGSRAPGTVDAHRALCDLVADHLEAAVVAPAFLEMNEPSIPEAIDAAVAEGADTVVLVPHFLHAGNHTRRDLPAALDAARARHPGVDLRLAEHLGADERIVAVLVDRTRDALSDPDPAG